MATQTVTHAVESDSGPTKFFNLLAAVENIPKWAPVFADSIERIGDSRYRVRKNGEAFEMEVVANPAACTVDYIREMPNGGMPGCFCTRVDETNWYERSLKWHEERSIVRSRS